MAWVDSLSQSDIAELEALHRKFGPTAFESYLILALVVRIHGPIGADSLDACIADWDDLVWPRISSQFDLRTDGYHLKGSRIPSPISPASVAQT
jgi:hypothetical protein